jgi:hypothetical protein
VAIAIYLDAPSPLSLRRRLYRHAAATIIAPMPVSLLLSRTSGWLLHHHLSRRVLTEEELLHFRWGKKLERIDMCDITPGNM